MKVLKILSGGVLAAALAFAPVSVAPAADGFIRVNEACGQATSCYTASQYICSTFHQDWVNYRCATGCDE